MAALASAEVIPYALPFREPYVTARGVLERREMVLLRLRDGDGQVGHGEAVPMSLRGDETTAAVARSLEEAARELVAGREPDPARIGSAAAAALDSARLELRAKREGLPLWRLLTYGAGAPAPIRCNATLTAGEPAEVVDQAIRWRRDGFATFKLKLGTGHDVETATAARDALGADARIRADANGAWQPAEARELLAAFEELDLELVEEPVSGLEAMAAARAETEVLIAADESVATPTDASRAFQLDACDFITVKLAKAGAVDLSPFPEPIPIYLSSALDGPVGIAAAAHAAQALRVEGRDAGIAHGLATQRLFAETIASVECELRGDMLYLPDGPGLGVEIDEAALERHRL